MKRIACLMIAALLGLGLSGPLLSAESSSLPDSTAVERLAGLCRLWGVVKYFHPNLAYRDIDWDAALMKAVPNVKAVRTSDEYRAAVEGMLSVLEDPATRVLPLPSDSGPAAPPGPRADSEGIEPSIEWPDEKTAVLRFPDYGYFADQRNAARLRPLFAEAGKAEAVVFDLRRSDPGEGGDMDIAAYYFARAFQMHFPALLSRDVMLPTMRYRMHSGYPSQGRKGSGGYYGGFVTMDGSVLAASGSGEKERSMVFVLDSRSAGLDGLISGLQIQGTARVVMEGKADAAGRTLSHAVELAGGLRAVVRTGEMINPDGSAGFAPDLSLPEAEAAEGTDRALPAALDLIRGRIEAEPRNMESLPAVAREFREKPYADVGYPSEEMRLLSLFRYWNVIHYFFPYKHLMDQPWEDVLNEFIPRMLAAGDDLAYRLTVAELGAHIQDTHGFMGGAGLSQYYGTHFPPVEIKTVEGRTVVTHLFGEEPEKAGLAVGDILLKVDGEDIGARRDRLARVLAVSTPQALGWRLCGVLLGGEKDSLCRLEIERADGSQAAVELSRGGYRQRSTREYPVHTMLPEGFGYVDLARLTVPEVDDAFETFADAPAVIFDMRGYPRGTAWSIGPRLADKKTAVASFQRPENHGTMPDQPSIKQFYQYTQPAPGKPRYTGKIVVLIDENAISQAEHTCLFFESVSDVTFIGSPTNGANGDVTSTILPGGISATFTGHDVRHADGRQLQRVGILPDIRVEPTIAGIRAAKDEVREAAVRFLLEKKGR